MITTAIQWVMFVLRHVAKIYKSCLRKENILCRIGGEEFAVVIPDSSGETASILAERIPTDTGRKHHQR